MLYTLLCFIYDDVNLFPIKIDDADPVGWLSQEIKENSQTLATVDARTLELYHINVRLDETGSQKHLKEAQKIGQDLGSRTPLEPWRELSSIGGGFPEGMLHILVVPPPGEPIHSRACRWRVVTDATPRNCYRQIRELFNLPKPSVVYICVSIPCVRI